MNGGNVLSQSSVSLAASSASDGSVMPLCSAVVFSAIVLLRRGAVGRGRASFSSVLPVKDAIEGMWPDAVCRRATLGGVVVGVGVGAGAGVPCAEVGKLTVSAWPGGV